MANSLTMVAESKLTEQLICKFCYHEDTATLNWLETASPPPPNTNIFYFLNRLTQNLSWELAYRALWSYSCYALVYLSMSEIFGNLFKPGTHCCPAKNHNNTVPWHGEPFPPPPIISTVTCNLVSGHALPFWQWGNFPRIDFCVFIHAYSNNVECDIKSKYPKKIYTWPWIN